MISASLLDKHFVWIKVKMNGLTTRSGIVGPRLGQQVTSHMLRYGGLVLLSWIPVAMMELLARRKETQCKSRLLDFSSRSFGFRL